MNIQNETIRINIDINDNAVKNLNNVILDLNDALGTLNTSIGNIQSTLNNLSSSSGSVNATSNPFGILALAMWALNVDSVKIRDNLSSLTKTTLPALSSELSITNKGIGGLATAFTTTTKKIGGTKVALGLFKLALKAIPFMLAIMGIQQLFNAIGTLVTRLNETLDPADEFRIRMERIGIPTRFFTAKIEQLEEELARLNECANATPEELAKIERELNSAHAAVTSMTGGIGLVRNEFNEWVPAIIDANDETVFFTSRLEQLRHEFNRSKRTTDQSSQAYEENMSALRSNSRIVGSHIDTVSRLTRQTNLTATEQIELAESVRFLDGHFTDLNIRICEETGLLNQSISSLRSRASTSDVLAFSTNSLAYAQELMNDLTEESLDLNRQYDDVREIHSRMGEVYREVTSLLADQGIEMEQLIFRQHLLGDSTDILSDSTEALNELREMGIITAEGEIDAILQLKEMHEDYTDQLSLVSEEIATNATNREQAAERVIAAEELMSQAAYFHTTTLEDLSDTQRSVVNRLVGYWETYAAAGRDMFNQLEKDTSLSLYEMANNMEHNRELTAQWSENLAILAERYGEEFADHMRSMGVESAGYVYAMVNDTEGHTARMAENYRLSAEQASENLNNSLGEGYEDLIRLTEDKVGQTRTTLSNEIESANFAEVGIGITRGLLDGVEQGSFDYYERLAELARRGQEAYKAENAQNSPSRVYKGFGEGVIQGLIQGIESLQAQSTNSMKQVAQNMKRTYKNANREYTNIGRDVMSGLNQGLQNGESGVMNTARRIADNVARTMRNALQINSPSRVMREQIGRQIPAGVAAGIDKYADYALDSVYDLGKELTKVDLPSLNDIISIGPSMSLASVGGGTRSSTHDSHITNNNYDRLFEGANIHWHNKEDIRKTMQEIAWATQREKANMW